MQIPFLLRRVALPMLAMVALALQAQEAPAKKPAFLILPGHGYSPLIKPDYPWLNELNKHGLDLDARYSDKLPPAGELVKF